MDVQTTLPKQVRASVGAEFQTPTPMVMARQIVMMDVRTTLPKQVGTSVGAEFQTPTPMVMARQIVMMDVRTTLPNQVRASVGAEFQTPTPMVIARQIVMMDVRIMQVCRVLTQCVDARLVPQSVEMAALNPVKRATTPMLPTATAAILTVHRRDVVMAS
jgi:hypothetical protein